MYFLSLILKTYYRKIWNVSLKLYSKGNKEALFHARLSSLIILIQLKVNMIKI